MNTEKQTIPYFSKFKGSKVRSGLPYPKWYVPIIGGIGGLIAIAALELLSVDLAFVACFIVPFGASCVLVFAAPAAPFSQPRNVILGHIFSALVGLAVFALTGKASFWSLAVANGVAIAVMAATKTIHPPAGATCLLPILGGFANWTWAFVPVGLGAVIIVLIGLLYNNIYKERSYPDFWW